MQFLRPTTVLAVIALLSILAGGIPVSAQTTSAADTQTPGPDEKVAVVNGQTIPRGELENELNQFKNRMIQQRRAVPPAMMADIEKRILEGLVDAELLFQRSQEQGVIIAPEVIAGQLGQVRQTFKDEAEFTAALKAVNLTEEKFSLMIQRRMAIQTVIDKEITPQVTVVEGEIQTYYDQNRARYTTEEEVRASHILIQLEENADDAKKQEALRKIGEIRDKLKEGQDFGEVAKTGSEGPSKVNGGDLGFFTRGKMVKPFSDAAFALAEGEVSDVVQTQFGYHLIKVTGKKAAETTSLEKVREKISSEIKEGKTRQLVTELIKTLRKSATIEIFL